jgi:hypothetical protein
MDSFDARQDWFLSKAEVKEKPFTSQTSVIGPLIVRLRTLWNSISTKWYIRPILSQQNHYNQLVAQRLSDIDNRLIRLDRQQAQLIHDVAELNTRLVQMNHLLQTLHTQQAARQDTPSDQP